MKKTLSTIIVLTLICCLVPIHAHAQNKFFVGGQVGIASSTSGYHGSEKNSIGSFSLSPEFGYQLGNDNWILGARLSLSHAFSDAWMSVSTDDGDISIEGITRYNMIGVNPFAMYHCLNAGPLEFWIEGGIEYNYSFNRGDVPGDKNYLDANIFGISILPVVSWQPFEHFSFFTELNCLSLGYTYSDIISHGQGMTSSAFSFGADSHSLIELSDITVGFRYWF